MGLLSLSDQCTHGTMMDASLAAHGADGKPLLAACIFHGLAKSVATATRLAQKRVQRQCGRGAYASVFALCDQFTQALNRESAELSANASSTDVAAHCEQGRSQ